MLREYQQRAIDQLYDWFSAGNLGNPCLNLPTGSGKSHIVAALCKDALQSWPDTRVIMCSHVRELVGQNAEKMRQHWPNAPLGIYSAGMGRRDIDRITFASIQSIRGKADQIGRRDLLIVDEAHTINNKAEGTYRQLIAELTDINPALRVVGLSATPHRLGQGLITEGDNALFSAIIEPVTIPELVAGGFLAPLKSKHTDTQIDLSEVKKRGGEFIPGQLERAIDQDEITHAAISETIQRAGDRRHWLLFCAGVSHAENCAAMLREYGISAACITGNTGKADRDRLIEDFKSGRITALTNANVLTTGFDAPDTDVLVMLRPTLSPALYVQMAGRGMRIKSHTDHCLVLDFAGNVDTHGPITGVEPPRIAGEGSGEAPAKACPDCDELVHASVMDCPECGYHWEAKPKPMKLRNDDIMGIEPNTLAVTDWAWSKHISRRSGKEMVKVKYYGGLADPVVMEWHPVTHGGSVGARALAGLARIAGKSGLPSHSAPTGSMGHLADYMNGGKPPTAVSYHKRGSLFEVVDRIWA